MRVIAAIVGLQLLLPAPALALPSDSGDAGPNLAESAGCGGVAGPLRPLSPYTFLLSAHRLYGPWADFYGRSRSQVEGSVVWWKVPGSDRSVRVHQRVLPALEMLSDRLAAEAAAGRVYPVSQSSAWVWRTVRNRRTVSQHAFGSAIDINWSRNPYREDNVLITDMPAWYVDAWTDAGFCWGGYWQSIKDTMHYSWMGPWATPGYGGRHPPYPPLEPAASFTERAVSALTPYRQVGADWYLAMADRRGEGADDLYAVHPHDGGWRVEVAGAITGFAGIGVRRDTAATVDADQVVTLADHDGDGHADLWVFDRSGSFLTARVYSDRSRFQDEVAVITTGASWEPGTELALGYYDWGDWILDLFVVRRGAQTTMEVYSGSSAYTERVLGPQPTGLGDTSDAATWELLLGDRNVDGVADLYAVQRAAPAQVRISQHVPGAGYGGAVTNLGTGISAGPSTEFVVGDYDGDGWDDLYALTAGRLEVYLGGSRDRPISDLTGWYTTNQPVIFDAGPECIGPNPCDQIGFVDDWGRWHFADEIAWGTDTFDMYYGIPGDVPFLGDWDGDGVATPGLYRRSDGFVYLRDTNTQGIADRTFLFGIPGDVPLVGDFDGDGKDTVSLYRPSEGRFYIINRLGEDGRGLGAAEYDFLFGDLGDKPFVGDFDGDGIDEVALHRESTGRVYYRTTLSEGVADEDFIYGIPRDVMLAGDWNGDGIDTVALYRPSDGNWYVKLANTQGVADHVLHLHGHGSVTRPFSGYSATSSAG